jgi:hypothetical protein
VIAKPAPHWEGTAIVKGTMKELKLTDYRFGSGANVIFTKKLDMLSKSQQKIIKLNSNKTLKTL